MTSLVTGDTRVGALLDAHPELQAVLVALSPEFKRLENPILRRTVARVATLAQAARIADLPVPALVNALRRALGQPELSHPDDAAPAREEEAPAWAASTPTVRLDAEAILARGATPVAEVAAQLATVSPGEIVAITAPFYPAPLVDAMRAKGHEVFARRLPHAPERWEVLLRR